MDNKETQQSTVQHRRFEGDVTKISGEKTISVLVKTSKMHPKYQKQYAVSKKYLVHDEKGEAAVGNRVVFEECRPLSKQKRWRLVQIVK
jgi:small subunit ribosomal protein S17